MSSTERAPDYKDKTDEAPSPPPALAGGMAPALEPNEARQGATHHNVRYVLGISLVGIVIAFAALYFFFASGGPLSPQ
jgi:hypothetical protein